MAAMAAGAWKMLPGPEADPLMVSETECLRVAVERCIVSVSFGTCRQMMHSEKSKRSLLKRMLSNPCQVEKLREVALNTGL